MHSASNQRARPISLRSRGRGRGYHKIRGSKGKIHHTIQYQRPNRLGSKHYAEVDSDRRKSYAETSDRKITTKSKYRIKKIIKNITERNEVLIEDNKRSVQQYVEYALDLLHKKESLIYITACNEAINKAINCVECITRKQYGIHQQSAIEIRTIKEIWEPLEYHLKEVIVENEVPYVKILLTFDDTLVNTDAIGYQKPLDYTKQLPRNLQHKFNKQQENYPTCMYKTDCKHEAHWSAELKQKKNIVNKQMMNKDIMEQFNQLQNLYAIQKQELAMMRVMREKYSDDFKCMKIKYEEQVEKNKVLQAKYDKLNQSLKITKKNKYDHLNASQSVEFIININKKRYEKYREGLLKGFVHEGVDGSCLNYLTKDDLYGFGVVNYADKISMYNSIKNSILF